MLETGEHKAIIVSRYNFEGDRRHHCPYFYPDKQLRFVVLNEGFHWCERLHAKTNAYELWTELGGTSPRIPREIVWLPHVNIYHYEGTRPIAERSLKWLNYERVVAGLPPLDVLPEGAGKTMPVRYAVEFVGPQPLDVQEMDTIGD